MRAARPDESTRPGVDLSKSLFTVGGDPGPRIRAAAFAHANSDPHYAAALELFGSTRPEMGRPVQGI